MRRFGKLGRSCCLAAAAILGANSRVRPFDVDANGNPNAIHSVEDLYDEISDTLSSKQANQPKIQQQVKPSAPPLSQEKPTQAARPPSTDFFQKLREEQEKRRLAETISTAQTAMQTASPGPASSQPLVIPKAPNIDFTSRIPRPQSVSRAAKLPPTIMPELVNRYNSRPNQGPSRGNNNTTLWIVTAVFSGVTVAFLAGFLSWQTREDKKRRKKAVATAAAGLANSSTAAQYCCGRYCSGNHDPVTDALPYHDIEDSRLYYDAATHHGDEFAMVGVVPMTEIDPGFFR